MSITELIPIAPIVDDSAMTRPLEQGETASLKLCAACGYEFWGRDRFCRHCGVERAEGAVSPFATVPFAAVNLSLASASGSFIKQRQTEVCRTL
jgi:hypothetical protein